MCKHRVCHCRSTDDWITLNPRCIYARTSWHQPVSNVILVCSSKYFRKTFKGRPWTVWRRNYTFFFSQMNTCILKAGIGHLKKSNRKKRPTLLWQTWQTWWHNIFLSFFGLINTEINNAVKCHNHTNTIKMAVMNVPRCENATPAQQLLLFAVGVCYVLTLLG